MAAESLSVSVREIAPGKWRCRPYLGTNRLTGRPIRPQRDFTAETEADALRLAREWVAGIAPAADLGITRRLGEVLESYIRWLSGAGGAPATAATYRSCARCYVEPFLGSADVSDVTPSAVAGMYNALIIQGGAKGSPLAPSTVRKTHAMLSGMYRWAVRQGICSANPMPSVDQPPRGRTEAEVFDIGEFRLIDAALADALHDAGAGWDDSRAAAFAAYLALHTGERCGEVCANVRADVRPQGSIHVGATMTEAGGLHRKKTPKTSSSVRNVAVAQKVLDEISAQVRIQDAFVGASDTRKRDMPLCCSSKGTFLRPSEASRRFAILRDNLGLPKGTSFHTLRHTHATYLLHEGIDIRTVSERLGHSKVTTTLELYAHVLPGRDAQAAEAFERAASGGQGDLV